MFFSKNRVSLLFFKEEVSKRRYNIVNFKRVLWTLFWTPERVFRTHIYGFLTDADFR
jgi:hypothetical protein